MCGCHCVAKNMEGWLKICTLFLIYNQIWLNLPRDNCHLSYIFQWMIATFSFDKKFIKKKKNTS